MSFNGWKEERLVEICDLISRGVTPSYTEDKEEGVIVINQKCIRDNSINLDLARLTNPNKKKIADNKYLKLYDILVNSTGVGTLGRVAQVKKLDEKMTVDSHVTIVRAKDCVNPEFLGYNLFMNQRYIEYLGEGSTGQTELSRIRLGEALKVKLPPIEEQKAIANILSNLDNKIEVNNKINQKLEKMAQAIFKQWFIDFDFPNKEGKPYKSSGGEMVESEIGMIPKGWNKYTIGDYCKVRSGYAFKSKWWSDEGVGVIKIKDIEEKTIDLTQLSKVNQEYTNKATEFEVVSGDLLIAMTGATVGKFGLVPKSKEKLFVNQRVGKFFLGEDPLKKLPFIFCSLNQSHVNSSIINIAQGSAQPNISASEIESIFTVNTDEQTIEKFNSFIYPVFKAYVQNIYEQSKLIKLRDTLLPKLMSGEIRVPIKN